MSSAELHLSSRSVHGEGHRASGELTNTLKSEDQLGHQLKAPEDERVYSKAGIKIMNIIRDTVKLN